MYTQQFRKVTYTAGDKKVTEYVMGSTNEEVKNNLLVNCPYATNIKIGKTVYNTLGELMARVQIDLPGEVLDKLGEMAKSQNRSRKNYIETVLIEHIKFSV